MPQLESNISEIARRYLRLHLCRGVGPIRAARLVEAFGGIDPVLTASAARLQAVDGIGPKIAQGIVTGRSEADVDKEIQLAEKHGVQIICREDPSYPELLLRIPDPPACLYIRGTVQREDNVGFGVVGARHATHYGIEQAERFAARAATVGMTVHSGLARGVDTAAHRGALAAGGRTIAVIGCGLSHLYPPDAIDLAADIAKSGCVMSELPMGVAPEPGNFPSRNRIIAGMSLGVLVVEAAQRSGALITARLANEYNREVYALPGRVDAPQSAGCHNLIRAGAAQLVTKFEDILDELGPTGDILKSDFEAKTPSERPEVVPVPTNLSPDETAVLAAIGGDPLPVESVCEACGIPPGQVAVAITTLQLKGLIRRTDGDLFMRP